MDKNWTTLTTLDRLRTFPGSFPRQGCMKARLPEIPKVTVECLNQQANTTTQTVIVNWLNYL